MSEERHISEPADATQQLKFRISKAIGHKGFSHKGVSNQHPTTP